MFPMTHPQVTSLASGLAVVRTLRDGPVAPGTINYGHLAPVTAVTLVDLFGGERECLMLYDFNVLKRVLGYWPYIFIAIALIGLAYALWISTR